MSQSGNQSGAPNAGDPANELASLDAQLDALLADAPKSDRPAIETPVAIASSVIRPAAPVADAPAPDSSVAAAEEAVQAIESQVDQLVSQFVDEAPAAEGSLADLAESLAKDGAVETADAGSAAAPEAASEAAVPVISDDAAPAGAAIDPAAPGVAIPGDADPEASTETSPIIGDTAEAPTGEAAADVPVASGSGAEAAVRPEPPRDIAALDDQLARLTDELLAGEPGADVPTPAPAEATEPVSQSAPAAPEASPAPGPESAPAPAAESAPPAVAVAAAPAAVAVAAPSSPVAPAKPEGMPVGARLRAALQRRSEGLAAVFAKPLAGKPKMVRDTVGWLGLNTIFLATLVWCYRLILQKPEQPVSAKAPIGLISGMFESEADARGAADEHGQAAAAEEHGNSKSGLGAVTALTKKKLTYGLSDAMAAKISGGKKDEKKDAKKSGGH